MNKNPRYWRQRLTHYRGLLGLDVMHASRHDALIAEMVRLDAREADGTLYWDDDTRRRVLDAEFQAACAEVRERHALAENFAWQGVLVRNHLHQVVDVLPPRRTGPNPAPPEAAELRGHYERLAAVERANQPRRKGQPAIPL
jgi:hypothetical protein